MRRICVLAAAIFVSAPLIAKATEDRVKHKGVVRDAATGQPLADVVVTAFPTSGVAITLDCMFHDGTLGTARSGTKGDFVLPVDPAPLTFASRYCADGYVTRVDNNDNATKAAIRPDPVILMKYEADSAAMKKALRAVKSRASRDVTSLIASNRYTVQQAVLGLPAQARMFIRLGGEPVASGTFNRAIAERVWRISADVLRNLEYLCSASPDAFYEAMRSMDGFEELAANTKCPMVIQP